VLLAPRVEEASEDERIRVLQATIGTRNHVEGPANEPGAIEDGLGDLRDHFRLGLPFGPETQGPLGLSSTSPAPPLDFEELPSVILLVPFLDVAVIRLMLLSRVDELDEAQLLFQRHRTTP
jgi:hypothetical protein